MATRKQPRKQAAPKEPQEPRKEAPASDADFFQDAAGQGFETVSAQDILLPRVDIIQKLSPQLDKSSPQFIKDAQEGDICAIGTGEIFKSLLFLPVIYRKYWIEWAPRKTKIGIVNVHSSGDILNQATLDDKRQPFLPNGNLIQETMQFYGFMLGEPGEEAVVKPRQAFISMKRTQLRKGRQWIGLATGEEVRGTNGKRFTPPFCYRTYILTSQPESNDEGNWMGWVIERGDTMAEYSAKAERPMIEMRESSDSMHQIVSSGAAQIQIGTNETAAVDADEATM